MPSIFYVFVPGFCTFAILCSATTSGEPCCEGRGYNDSSEAITGQTDVLQKLDQEDACECKGGYCENENGTKVCKCYGGWGLVSKAVFWRYEYYCQKCDCGGDYNCTYINRRYMLSKKCLCPDGYEDSNGTCKDKCSLLNCKNDGKCGINDGKAFCNCTERFTGTNCETDKCSLLNCKNDGKCGINDGNAFCNCTERFTGTNCERDKCSLLNCKNDGKCGINDDKAFCNCTERFTGTNCERDKCSLLNCKNDGECGINDSKAFCNCTERFTGPNCERDKCSLLNCKNDGKCGINDGKAFCNCTDRFTGTNCEKDKCSSLDCKNGGKCGIKGGKAFCNCTDRYTGVNCEKVHLCMEVCGVRYDEHHDEFSCYEFDFGGVTCLCKDPNKLFDRVEKKCKVDKCWERCGVSFVNKEGDLLCKGDPFGNVKCFCRDGTRVFNPEEKKCQGEYKTLYQFIWILCSIIILLASIIGCFTLSRCRKNFGGRQSGNC